MGTSLQGIMNMSQLSLANNQTALTIVSNNVANMNNEDYSKQNVKISAIKTYNSYGTYYSKGGMQIGQGAHITDIYRNREQWLDNYFRDQNTKNGYFEQLTTMTNDIENLLNDELSSTGLQKKLTAFFSAAQSLTAEPTNNAYRIAYVEAAEDVADYFNGMSQTIKADRKQLVGDVDDPDSLTGSTLGLSLDELNNKLAQLAEINGNIAQTYASGSASCDLLDKRDKILDEITKFIPVTITTNENLTTNVYLGNKALVKSGEQKLFFEAVQTTDDDNPVQIQLKDVLKPNGDPVVSNANDMITNGSISAMLDAGGSDDLSYKSVLNEIDKLAKAFAEELNNIQTATIDGTDPYCFKVVDGKTVLTKATEPLFEIPAGGVDINAGNIKINKKLLDDPSLIATARGTDLEDSPAIGNSMNLALVNKLQTKGIADLAKGGTTQTIDNFIKTLVTTVGSKIEGLNTSASTQADLLAQATEKRANITSVDLNEELTDLIKYQRSYEASARVFTTASSLLETIINLGR